MNKLGKIKFNFVLNIALFIIYYVAVLNHGMAGVLTLTMLGLGALILAYFVLFGMVIWIDVFNYIKKEIKK